MCKACKGGFLHAAEPSPRPTGLEPVANSSCCRPGSPFSPCPPPCAAFFRTRSPSQDPPQPGLGVQLASWLLCCLLVRLHGVSYVTLKTTCRPAPKPLIGLLVKLQDKRGHIPVVFEVTGYWAGEIRCNLKSREGGGEGFSLKSVFLMGDHHAKLRAQEQRGHLTRGQESMPGPSGTVPLKPCLACRSLGSPAHSLVLLMWGRAWEPALLTNSQGFPGKTL